MRVKVVTEFACDFCGKTHSEVGNLIRGGGDSCICYECVTGCVEVIAKESEKKEEGQKNV